MIQITTSSDKQLLFEQFRSVMATAEAQNDLLVELSPIMIFNQDAISWLVAANSVKWSIFACCILDSQNHDAIRELVVATNKYNKKLAYERGLKVWLGRRLHYTVDPLVRATYIVTFKLLDYKKYNSLLQEFIGSLIRYNDILAIEYLLSNKCHLTTQTRNALIAASNHDSHLAKLRNKYLK